MDPPQDIPLSSNERYQYVSLWSIISAPYFFSANMDELDDFTISLLRNADLANVNQDELGHVAEIVREDTDHIVLMKKLVDGSVVAGILNTNPENDKVFELKWEEIGMSGKRSVRDLWRQKELGIINNSISVNVSANGVALLKVE
jgi:alpha-galactosidase